jgi:putative colanic acid biosynthesis acetyltransferase WcaF
MSDRHILDARAAGSRAGGASFPLRHRLLRAAWIGCWGLLASWTPPMLHGWRRTLLRLFGASVAKTARIHGSVRVWYPPNLTLGDNALVGPGVHCYSMAPIRIGADAVVSQRAHLCAGTHDVDDPHFQLKAMPIEIGAGAWVATEAFVGPGVAIGEGAVLGARGVTVKDLDAWGIYAGNPARFIRTRRRHQE